MKTKINFFIFFLAVTVLIVGGLIGYNLYQKPVSENEVLSDEEMEEEILSLLEGDITSSMRADITSRGILKNECGKDGRTIERLGKLLSNIEWKGMKNRFRKLKLLNEIYTIDPPDENIPVSALNRITFMPGGTSENNIKDNLLLLMYPDEVQNKYCYALIAKEETAGLVNYIFSDLNIPRAGYMLFFIREIDERKKMFMRFHIKNFPGRESCTDTDAEDIYNKGSITYTDLTGAQKTEYDECTAQKLQVNERWCYEIPEGSGNFVPGKKVFDCPNGCEDGACKKEASACSKHTDCTDNQYCKFDNCLAETGKCEMKPTTCPTLIDPVCGCDDNTYPNECAASVQGVSVKHKGECEEECVELGGAGPNASIGPDDPNANKVCCEGMKFVNPKNIYDATCKTRIVGYGSICAACGDGRCDDTYENYCNCPEDCPSSL